jgi:UDP-N-acetylmuramoyl-tripeptide--D-alanyl-D-alanine ligase
VCVLRHEATFTVFVDGEELATDVPAPVGIQATNVACAVAVALQLGVPAMSAVDRLATIPSVPNRLTPGRSASGVLVLDDTFNANPAGTRAALTALAAIGSRRRVLVTPGMVELGPRQRQENRDFAEAAARVVTDLVVVGRTNRRPLMAGAAPVVPIVVGTREQAVAWVRTHLGLDDAVLYVNDLPDHYP